MKQFEIPDNFENNNNAPRGKVAKSQFSIRRKRDYRKRTAMESSYRPATKVPLNIFPLIFKRRMCPRRLFQSRNWERERFIKTSFSKTDFALDAQNNAPLEARYFVPRGVCGGNSLRPLGIAKLYCILLNE